MEIKVYTAWNKPKAKPQNVRQEIYEYEYIEKATGEVKKRKINVQEKIQSNLERVNYKKQIERGEILLNDSITGEGIRDYTSLPGDKVNFIDFIVKIGQLSPEQISQMVKQVSGVSEGQSKESKQENGETVDTTKQGQPDSGGNPPQVNGGTN